MKIEQSSWAAKSAHALAFIDRKGIVTVLKKDSPHYTWGEVSEKVIPPSKPADKVPSSQKTSEGKPKDKPKVTPKDKPMDKPKDKPKVKVDLVIPEETITYTSTCLNSWFLMLCDLCLEGYATSQRVRILNDGLFATLKRYDATVDRILGDRWLPERAEPELWGCLCLIEGSKVVEIYRKVWQIDDPMVLTNGTRVSVDIGDLHTFEGRLLVRYCRIAIMLLVLRYLKRYSPNDVNIEKECCDKFRSVNKKCKDFTDRYLLGNKRLTTETYDAIAGYKGEWLPNRVITSWMRGVVREVLGDAEPVTTVSSAFSRKELRDAPPGAVEGVCKCTFCKAYAYTIIRDGMGMADRQEYAVRIKAVNKSWKAKRLIAPEDMYHAVLFRENERIIDKALTKSPWSRYIPLHDQTQSNKLAWYGSFTGEYATIDCSSASDSISRLRLYSILPRKWRRLLDNAAYYGYVGSDTNKIRLGTALTSGNGCTFVMESSFFFSLCYVTCRLHGVSREEMLKAKIPLFLVYGDDIIIRVDFVPLLLELLAMFGITVNKDKSFYDKDFLYRESCGGEYYDGFVMTPFYWPRNYNNPEHCLPDEYGSNNRTASLVALVNRFAWEEDAATPCGNRAHQYLLAVLKGFYPKLTLGGDVLGVPHSFVDMLEKRSCKDHIDSFADLVTAVRGDKWPDKTITHIEADITAKVDNKLKPLSTTYPIAWYSIHEPIDGVTYTGVPISAMSLDGPIHVKKLVGIECRKHLRIAFSVFAQRLEVLDLLLEYGATIRHTGNTRIPTEGKDTLSNARKRWYSAPCVQSASPSNYTINCIWNSVLQHASRGELEKFAMESVFIDACPQLELMAEMSHYQLGNSELCYWRAGAAVFQVGEIRSDLAIRNDVSLLTTDRVKHDAVNKANCPCHWLSEEGRRAWWTSYVYGSFLENGPIYNDEIRLNEMSLNEVLKVSDRRMTYESAYSGRASKLTQKLK